jgi:hypothetical protein
MIKVNPKFKIPSPKKIQTSKLKTLLFLDLVLGTFFEVGVWDLGFIFSLKPQATAKGRCVSHLTI